jgi:hypothetical protein
MYNGIKHQKRWKRYESSLYNSKGVVHGAAYRTIFPSGTSFTTIAKYGERLEKTVIAWACSKTNRLCAKAHGAQTLFAMEQALRKIGLKPDFSTKFKEAVPKLKFWNSLNYSNNFRRHGCRL